MSRDAYTVVGGGAIGGTLAHHLSLAGHRVTVVDADAEHVAAINAHGLAVHSVEPNSPAGDGPSGEHTTARVDATTPEEYQGPPLKRVLLAVKAQATEDAMGWIAPRLADDGYVVSLQNGFNEPLIAEHVGAERTVAAFVNIFADVIGPGQIRDGGSGALVVGEPGGAPVSERVNRLVSDLQAWGPARASDNIEGFLWAKAGFGAMLAATALADAAMADLIDRHRPAMFAAVREVFDTAEAAGVRLESFDAFEAPAFRRDTPPHQRDAATDRLTAWLRTQPKDRSGIWRDLAVRRRRVEVTTHYATVLERAASAGVATPVLTAVLAGLRELEADPTTMSEKRLEELDRLATGSAQPTPPATPPATAPKAATATTAGRATPTAPDAALARSVQEWIAAHQEQMVDDLARYTAVESPSDSPEALDNCLEWLRCWLDERLGTPAAEERLPGGPAGDVLIRRYAATPGTAAEPATGAPSGAGDAAGAGNADGARLLLLCHYDTVWPLGTLDGWPFQRDGDRITGPGVFDMKAGLVQAVWALRALDALGLPRPACTLLLNGDEETGSHASSDTIATEARAADAALVFEASAEGAVKTARKGVGLFTLTTRGREAHAGLDPTAPSAIEEAAHQVLRLRELSAPEVGTTVNVGVLAGGTRSNVIAGRTVAELDVRVATAAEQRRVDEELAATRPVDPRAEAAVTGGWNRPVFERTEGVARLYELARACAAPLGLDLREASVGGASDGNFALAAGVPVLDGIGAVGGGAHARDEHATVSGMTERSALAAGVITAFAQPS